MADIANITVTGRLTQDGEVRYTSNGTAVLRFGLACNRWKNGSQKTSFYDCEMWGQYGEKKAQIAKKGTHCIVNGAIDIDEFEGNNGKMRKMVITVNTLEPSPGASNDDSGYQAPPQRTQPRPQQRPQQQSGYKQSVQLSSFDKFDDDIPF